MDFIIVTLGSNIELNGISLKNINLTLLNDGQRAYHLTVMEGIHIACPTFRACVAVNNKIERSIAFARGRREYANP